MSLSSARRAIVISTVGAIVAALAASAAATPTAAPASAVDPLSSNALMRTLDSYSALGPDHLTGTADEARTQSWFAARLQADGVEVGRNAYTYLGFHPKLVSLRLEGQPAISSNIAAYFYSGTTAARGITAPLVDAGHGTAAEVSNAHVAGKIAVVELPSVNGLTEGFTNAFSAVESDGAAGMVAVTDGPANYPVQQDVDSREGLQHLPTVILGSVTGQHVIAAADANTNAKLTLQASVGTSCDTDVWGVLPGSDPDRYEIVGTPTSGFDPAASERGAGVAAELGLAQHYAALPQSQRPVGLVFAGLSGHEVGYLGLPILMQTHPNWFDMTDAYIHLGASIAAAAQDPTGTAGTLPVGDPTRSLYVSENPPLEAAADKSFASAEPLGSVPPSVSDPGEQSEAYAAGVPIIGESGSSKYFHTAGDTPSGVSATQLAGQATAFNSAIGAVSSLPAGDVRAANQAPDEASRLNGGDTTPGGKTAAAIPADEPQPVRSCADQVPLQPAPTTAGAVSASDAPIGLGQAAGYESDQPAFAWQGNWQQRAVSWTSSATGATLTGVEFAPSRPPTRRVPGVVIVPGSGPGAQSFYQWSARDLAGHGYIALVVDPQGVGKSGALGSPVCSGSTPPGQATPCPGVPFQQNANYVDAAESGVDYLDSSADPYRGELDSGEIGLAGHSLGARAVSYVQGIDKRVKAIAAWDNLASDLNGDAGSASGGPPVSEIVGGGVPGAPAAPVTPRVPALGEASDSQGVQTDNSDEIKKTAYDAWVSKHVPSMEVVFNGASHDDWGQAVGDPSDEETRLYRFEWYTRAWFDLFLKHQQSAVARLTATHIRGTPLPTVVSTKFRSALYLPNQDIDCPNLVASGCP
jgi:dienelactone hydrolase